MMPLAAARREEEPSRAIDLPPPCGACILLVVWLPAVQGSPLALIFGAGLADTVLSLALDISLGAAAGLARSGVMMGGWCRTISRSFGCKNGPSMMWSGLGN